MENGKLPAHFLARRIHSLSGIIPIGAFLLVHTYTNSKSLAPDGVALYNGAIKSFSEIPFLVFLEIVFVYLPILFHAGYGFVILYQGKSNVTRYGSEANIRYTLQRITGMLALVFIGYHVYATRWTALFTGQPMEYLWMVRMFETPWKVWFYLAGTTAVCFHFANGLWTFLIVWGITVSRHSQRVALYACMAVFAGLSVVNLLMIANFTYYHQPAPVWIAAILGFVKMFLFRGV
ncbi:MAG: succinate dehydrogenase [Deltaproteobacteria bacterium]|nr:succinate dehydrogenase [Deltaproteobacteria bacterium]